MMDAMRNAAKTWVAKILLGILALTFGVWGIADVFNFSRQGPLVTVGEQEVSAEDYSRALNSQLQQFAEQTGTPLTIEDARKLGIDRSVLNQLIQTAVVDDQIQKLSLGVSDAFIVAETAANPAFHDSSGKFDKDAFLRTLAAAGLSEEAYLAGERRDRLRKSIADAVNEDFTPPKALIDALYRDRSEQRDARYFVVKAAETEVPAPGDDEIKKQYDGNPQSYTAPEYRTIALMTVAPADIAKNQAISAEDIATGYEKYKLDYFTPERRTILQLAFPDEAAAKKAKERLDGGLDFLALAKEMGVTEADMTFTDAIKKDFIDPAVAEAAFALAEGAVSEPVKGALTVTLLKAVNITPEKQETLEEVKAKLTERLQLEKATEVVLAIYDQVEDARAAQTKFEDIAQTTGITFQLIGPVDATGRGNDGKDVTIPHGEEVLRAAFASDVGVENDAVSNDNDYVWYEVREVAPSVVRPLDEVKDAVVKDILAAKVRELALEKATKLAERAKSGTPLETLAAEVTATVQSATGLKRNETSADFDAAAVQAVFAIPENAFTVAPEGDGKGAKVIQSQAVLLPPFDAASAEAKEITEQTEQGIGADALSSYLASLQDTSGVTINEELWRQIAGTTQQ
jgi:peptidyl-prolyl cis-trans isomerase D